MSTLHPALAAAVLHDRLVAEALAAPLLDLTRPIVTADLRDAPARFLERAAMLGGAARAEAVWRYVWQVDAAARAGTGGGRACTTPADALLLRRLMSHASVRLRRAGAVWVLRADSATPARELLAWRWLSLRLPTALLTLLADADLDPLPPHPATHLRLLDPALAPTGKTAHLHLHDGANFAEPSVWATASDIQRGTAKGALPATSAIPTSLLDAGLTGEGFDGVLRVAGLLERDLMERLGPQSSRIPEAAAAFERLVELLGVCPGERHRQAIASAAVWFNAHANDIRSGWGPRATMALTAAGSDLTEPHRDERRRALLRAAVRGDGAMTVAPRRHELLALLRLRALLHDHLVHDPAFPSLSTFVGRFSRAKWYEKLLEALRPAAGQSPATRAAPDLPSLAAVELRDGPKGGHNALARMQARDRELRSRDDGVDRTVITHFIRTPQAGTGPGKALSSALSEAAAMAGALGFEPELARTYRGVDLAGDERRGPLLLFAAAVRLLRDAIDCASLAIDVRGAGVTVHAGESFDSPWTGLRAIDECFLFELLRPGDRIGHATVLSRPIGELRGQGPLLQPRLERMLDLMWLLHRAAGGDASPVPAATAAFRWLAELRQHLRAVCGAASGEATDVHSAVDTYVLAGRCQPQRPLDSRTPGLLDAPRDSWLARWLDADDPSLHTVLSVEVGPEEIDLAEATRLRLLQRIAASRIAIEANPSSNLLLAGHAIPLEQPTWRAHPLAPGATPTVAITLSTDDPIQFATCLADEIAYAWAGGVLAGAAPEHMRVLIEQAARNAWAFRFGLDANDAR